MKKKLILLLLPLLLTSCGSNKLKLNKVIEVANYEHYGYSKDGSIPDSNIYFKNENGILILSYYSVYEDYKDFFSFGLKMFYFSTYSLI